MSDEIVDVLPEEDLGPLEPRNPPAFPVLSDREYERAGPSVHALDLDSPGMTLRDWFAGQALIGIAPNNDHEAAAQLAYRYADAMLRQRGKDVT